MAKEYNVIGFYKQNNETTITMNGRLSHYQLIKIIYFLNLR